MHYLLLGIVILFHSYNYSQDFSDTGIVEEKEQNVLLPLGKKFLFNTFTPYKNSRKVVNDLTKWKLEVGEVQKEYKVSLVGVNINSWLENPRYFDTLEKEAKEFPVTALLDNLQSNNPDLIFNDPSVVSKALKTDIYSPYLQNVSNSKSISLLFSDMDSVISYTRRFHIYGASAGNLPYFGRPIEGGGREINLALLNGQIDEIAVKLPETDIFLVAMINVIPNWLEEGLDIFHVSQQRMEILVYAFDRKGKLIGGAGVPMNFLHNGKTFVMEQQIVSKVWQPGVSRQFYILPSFNLLNTKNTKEVAESADIIVPIDKYPALNRNQRYILHAIMQLREEGMPIESQLFTADGNRTLELRDLKPSPKVHLANRILDHKDTKTFKSLSRIQNIPMELSYDTLMVRLQNQQMKEDPEQKKLYTKNPRTGQLEESDISLSERALLLKEYHPSNEGDKLTSLVKYTYESLWKTPFTHTNQLYYTNEVLSYELETDPILYRSKEKKYFFLKNAVANYKKEYKQETKKIIKNEKLKQKDQIFWFEYLLERLNKQNLSSVVEKEKFDHWLDIYKKMSKENLTKIKLERQQSLYSSLNEEFYKFKNRNMLYLNEQHSENPKKLDRKLAQLAKNVDKQQRLIDKHLKDEKMLEQYSVSKQLYEELAAKEKESRSVMLQNIPININYMKEIENETTNFLDISLIAKEQADLVKETAKQNNVSPELVSVALSEERLSPMKKESLKEQRKQKKLTSRLFYEGFVLGLTSNWKTRTRLKDRVERL